MFVSKCAQLGLARNAALGGMLLAALVLSGCGSCKEFEEQILQLDAQVADLQQQVVDKDATLTERDRIAESLRSDLRALEAEKTVLVEKMEETVSINIPDHLLFVSGSDVIRQEFVPTLKAIAERIRQYPAWEVFVAGHTDDKKIAEEWQEKWPTNWELGADRACAVVRYLTNQLGLPADKFSAVSYGPFRPLADNANSEGRTQNRRVMVVLHKPTY